MGPPLTRVILEQVVALILAQLHAQAQLGIIPEEQQEQLTTIA